MSVVCLIQGRAQTVNEKESSITIKGTSAEVSLAVESADRLPGAAVSLELLDAQNKVRTSASQPCSLRPGKTICRLALPLGEMLKTEQDDFFWFRLQYRVGQSTGVVSLSELLKDIFELRASVPRNFLTGSTYRVRVRALNPYSLKAVKGVKVDGEFSVDIATDPDEDELKLKATGQTDGKGFVILDFKIPDGIIPDHEADVDIVGTKNGITREIDGDPNFPENRGGVFLTVDKPLYQPGQDFSVRGLFLDPAYNVVPGTEIEFEIEDGDETVLYREKVKTSAFGIASALWKIPENAKLGTYVVKVSFNGEEMEEFAHHFKVTRYDLPNFTVSAKADRSYYLPSDQNAGITVSADYLFGKPVKKGKVRLVQENERHWNWKEQKYDVEESSVFEGVTDAEGKYTATVDLSGEMAELNRKKWERFKDIHFAAYFTDTETNRTEQKRIDIRLTKQPIHIYFMRYGENSTEMPFKAYISTFYADGTPAVCDVTVTGDAKNAASLKTNTLGAGKIDLDIPERLPGDTDYRLKITAADKKGRTGTFEESLYVQDGDQIRIETDKAIYKNGDIVDLRIMSTRKSGLVYIDVVKDWSVVASFFTNLKNGKSSLRIPYNKMFKGELTIAAYTDDIDDYNDIRIYTSRGIIFPEQQNLRVTAKFDADTYRPSEEAKLRFSVLDGSGNAVESALGIVIFDKAVEERAKTDAEFGGYFGRFYGLMGYGTGFGDISLKDLNDLDMSQPVPEETQLAAEIMLANNRYYPEIDHSSYNLTQAQILYSEFFKNQLDPVGKALLTAFERSDAYPNDEAALTKILAGGGIDEGALRDPWGQKYIHIFATNKTQFVVTFRSAGADKTPGTYDDFDVLREQFAYFKPLGNKIDAAVLAFHAETGGYIRDIATLRSVLSKAGIDPEKLKDAWNRDYRITFETVRRNFVVRFHSDGENGKYEAENWDRDDFDVWTSEIDYFAETEARLRSAIGTTLKSQKGEAPKTETEFRELLKTSNLDLAQIRDAFNEQVYLASDKQNLYTDKVVIEGGKEKITPVTREMITFRIRSMGPDKVVSPDDFDLMTFSTDILDLMKNMQTSTGTVNNVIFSGASGAIHGVVKDPNGAVIPGVVVKAFRPGNETSVHTATTDEEGEFLIENLPSGRYTVAIEAAMGFEGYRRENIDVRSMNLVEMEISLWVAGATATVSVTGSAELDQSSSMSATSVKTTYSSGKIAFPYPDQTSTPRLREYFPETLLWKPEVITDKKGRAELSFKLADNITTWKMYTIASTKKGKVGIVEKEITAFQPFFVDLDPPKVLTSGDEISLPVQIRNYTEKKQKVDVSMAKADWFSFLAPGKQQIEVGSGESQNAVFAFKATDAVNGGKQRVTALAQGDSDAIEKPVTVRPDGEEIVKTETSFFKEATSFDVNFPVNALPKTQKAELKIYPNLFSHVAESVEGLLKRPYGCGEQTISSTYPNLMVLKFTKEDSRLRQTAQKYLQKGYERLIGYQVADGGFTYWGGKDTSDLALTAYALRFLNDAKEFIEVDETIVKNARDWLVKQQRTDGSWTKKYYYETTEDTRRTKLSTSYVARTLAAIKEKDAAPLQKALGYLKARNAEIDEPYALALYGLASLDAGNAEEAAAIADRLEKMAIAEGSAVYWKLETNTPFYGWGTAGRLETTALVLQLLLRAGKPDETRSAVISKGTLFLLRNKDRYGVWYSTQTTINVLDAFLAALAPRAGNAAAETIQVLVNGTVVQTIPVAPDRIEPLVVDLQPVPGPNKVEIRNGGAASIMAQVVQAHYIDWKDSESAGVNTTGSRSLRLDYKCDKTSAAIMQDITCSVEAERVGFQGYGMLLAEIGTPPGADVSRESLQAAMDEGWNISRYDILPDRIVVYMWAKAGGTKFSFKFRPRYGINAQTPASTIYDYYNPDARVLAVPLRFTVK
jgi:hypothetical protein